MFKTRFRNAKQKCKTDKKSLEITGGCVCEGDGAECGVDLALGVCWVFFFWMGAYCTKSSLWESLVFFIKTHLHLAFARFNCL